MDEKLLTTVLAELYPQLTAEERFRNRVGCELVILHNDQPLARWLKENEICSDEARELPGAVGEGATVLQREVTPNALPPIANTAEDCLAWPYVGPEPAAQPYAWTALPVEESDASNAVVLAGQVFPSPLQVCG